jgi:small subunit ribosomal protein S6
MRLYETTFILSPQADDVTFDRQIKAVSDVIRRYDGQVLREHRWGIRRLAYPIRRFTQGYYARIIFDGNQKALSELERFFKIEEPYIRYLTVVYEGNLEKEPEREIGPVYGATAEQATPAAAVQPEAPTEEKADDIPAPKKSGISEEEIDKYEEKFGEGDI